jgi:hypothetical protein
VSRGRRWERSEQGTAGEQEALSRGRRWERSEQGTAGEQEEP